METKEFFNFLNSYKGSTITITPLNTGDDAGYWQGTLSDFYNAGAEIYLLLRNDDVEKYNLFPLSKVCISFNI